MHPTFSSFYMGVGGMILGISSSPFGMTHVLTIQTVPMILLIVNGFFGMCMQITLSAAYVTDGVAKMALIKYSSIVFTYIIDIIYFGYTFTFYDSLSTFIILSAILSPTLINLNKK